MRQLILIFLLLVILTNFVMAIPEAPQLPEQPETQPDVRGGMFMNISLIGFSTFCSGL